MGQGIGVREKTIRLITRKIGQLNAEQEEIIGPPEGHLEGTLATGGVIHLTLAKGCQCLPHDPAQGQAGLRQQDAWRGRAGG